MRGLFLSKPVHLANLSMSFHPLLGMKFAATATVALVGVMLHAAPSAVAKVPIVVDVPNGPAFVKLPGKKEVNARSGQDLLNNTVLRTAKPGRMHIKLSTGRQFRMGGNSLLQLKNSTVKLEKGALIGWIQPGLKNRQPFTIQTRHATASIQGTTVFIELDDEKLKIFSWEGEVKVDTTNGESHTLRSGEQLLVDLNQATVTWPSPVKIKEAEASRRLTKSRLINGFAIPMDTLQDIERELGVKALDPS